MREHLSWQVIGAGAVNQAVKALVLAIGYLRNDGIHINLNQVVSILFNADVITSTSARPAKERVEALKHAA